MVIPRNDSSCGTSYKLGDLVEIANMMVAPRSEALAVCFLLLLKLVFLRWSADPSQLSSHHGSGCSSASPWRQVQQQQGSKENTRPHWEGCDEATDGTCLYRQESEEERVPLLPDDACMGAAANRQVALMVTNPTDHECSCKYEVALMATNPYRPLLEQCLYHPGAACMDACRRGIKFAYLLSTHPVKVKFFLRDMQNY